MQENLARSRKFILFLAEIYHPYTNYQVRSRLPSALLCWIAICFQDLAISHFDSNWRLPAGTSACWH